MPNYLFTIILANRLQNYKKKCTYARVHAIFSCFFYNLSKVFDFTSLRRNNLWLSN